MLLLAIFATCACTTSEIYNSHHPIHNRGWEECDTLTFTIDIPQPGRYNANIFIRHSTDYPYSNLWLFVDHTYSNKRAETDTIEIIMADSYGHWQGNGWGMSRQIKYNILHNQPLDSGTHTINITHAMRKSLLSGINNVGVTVEPSYH